MSPINESEPGTPALPEIANRASYLISVPKYEDSEKNDE